MSGETATLTLEPITAARKNDTFDLLIYWRSMAKRKWSIMGLAVAATLLTALAVNTMTPIYRSTATVLIEQNRAKVAPTEEVYANVGDSREHFQTQAEILKSRALAVKVVDKLRLTKHPDLDPRQQEPALFDRIKKQLGFAVEERVWSEAGVHGAVVGALMSRTIVEPVRLSQLIKISFESADPMAAAEIANAIADTYIDTDQQARYQMTKRASGWLGDRLSGLKKTLEDSERALQEYRERARIIETRGLAQSGATRDVEDLLGRVVAARQRRFAAEHAYQQINGAKGQLDILPVVMRNPLVVRLKEVESEAERRLADSVNRFGYGPEHPRMMQAEADLKQARENARQQVEIVVSSLLNEYELSRTNENVAERALAAAKSNVQQINRKEFELGSLERAVATNRQIYELFLNRFKETQAAPDLESNAVARLTDEARPSQYPVKPKKEQMISMAFVLALFLGILIALLRERLENTLKSADDVEEKLGQPMLTMLPLLLGNDARSVGRHYLEDSTSVFSEGIRTARTSVLLLANNSPRLTLLITSSVPGEGKTAIAINLGLAEAQTKRVLLIDADFRRPSLGAQLRLDPDKPGLTNLLSGSASFAQCLQRVEGSSLYAITSGPVPPNPLEMMMSRRFQQLMTALAGTCDVLIVDSPPVHLVSDALVLSKMATGVLFVVKADSTPYPLVRKCIHALEEVDARLFGVTLNQLDFRKAERYYGAYTGSYYKYDGYYTKSSKPLAHQNTVPALRT